MDRTWRQRLIAAIENDKRSLRAIGQAASKTGFGNVGETYVWELVNTTREPTISKLQAVCAALNVSVIYILEGIEISAENERLWRAVSRMPSDQRKSFLDWLEKR